MRNKFGLILVFLLLASPAFAATQLKKTVMPSGGDYTSLEACMNANEQNLVTADKYFDVEIDGTWSSADTTAVTIHNYTTDATRYINIYTTAAARHAGVYSTSKYYLYYNTWVAAVLDNSVNYVSITGIQVNYNAGNNERYGLSSTGTNCILDKIILYQNTVESGSDPYGIRLGGASSIVKNSIVLGPWDVGIRLEGGAIAYNCIAVGARTYGFQFAFLAGSTINCAALSNTSGDFNGDPQASPVSDYNASSDTTAKGTHTVKSLPYTTDTFTNVTSGSEDFHLAAGSDLIDVGTDLSGTFTDDIDGETRSGTWDIGADEYSSGEPPAGVVPSPYYYQMLMGGNS